MRYVRIFFYSFVLFIASCASTPSGPPPPQEFWFHPERLSLAGSQEDLRKQEILFEREFNECKVEMYKIAIPAPTCTVQDCTGKTGFALGFCQGYNPCDYSAVNSAKNSRTEVLQACMGSKGHMLLTKEKFDLYYPEVRSNLNSIRMNLSD